MESERLLQQAKVSLKEGDNEAAHTALNEVLQLRPKHRDALYYLAVMKRQSGDLAAARETLKPLLAEHSDYGRAYQELGHCHLAMKQAPLALEAYQRALSLNPSLIASWKSLALLYRHMGKESEAGHALEQAKHLSQLPAELLTVESLVYEKKLYVAENICRRFLRNEPRNVEAMRLLAKIANELQILDDAEILLENCAEIAPDYLRARLDYIRVLHRRQRFEKALEQARQLYQVHSSNSAVQIALASELQAVGEFDSALETYDEVVANNPELAAAHTARGHLLKTVGRAADAVASYRNAYSSKADFGDAYWSLANLKTYRFSAQEIDAMRAQIEQAQTVDTDRVHLCFALGKALEDRELYAESFAYYEQGNSIKQRHSGYRSEKTETDFRRQKELFNGQFLQSRGDTGCKDKAPIFIVGLPRAGSTLLEQILASHSQVDGTMELANIIGLAHRLTGRADKNNSTRYPDILATLDAKTLKRFGEDFIRDTAFHRQGGAFFTDKMPNNFRHIGLIHLILPNAKIIDARRHPMACCFSGFKQYFAEGQEFSYGLESIGRYYRAYVELMRHWDSVLPGKVLKVQHEDVIDDLEGQVKRILEFCELPFEQQCIDFHETERAVRTPSAEQVRQPIYASGMGQWQHYAAHLKPMEEALGPALYDYL